VLFEKVAQTYASELSRSLTPVAVKDCEAAIVRRSLEIVAHHVLNTKNWLALALYQAKSEIICLWRHRKAGQ